jgi:hypothetical protein
VQVCCVLSASGVVCKCVVYCQQVVLCASVLCTVSKWCYVTVAGSLENRYTCCDADLSSRGCQMSGVSTNVCCYVRALSLLVDILYLVVA